MNVKGSSIIIMCSLSWIIQTNCHAQPFDWLPLEHWKEKGEIGILTKQTQPPVQAWEDSSNLLLNTSLATNLPATINSATNTVLSNSSSNAISTQLEFSKGDVLLRLFEQDRDEIKFWQDKFFTVSFWIAAAMLAIAGLVADKFPPHKAQKLGIGEFARIRCIAAFVCFGLGCFYESFADEAHRAMVHNQHDLQGIEIALSLNHEGWYLQDQAIYPVYFSTDAGKYGVMGHPFVGKFVWFDRALAFVLMTYLLWPLWRGLHPQPAHDETAQKAYALWQDLGRPPGMHNAIWHTAEARLHINELHLPLWAIFVVGFLQFLGFVILIGKI